jgi:TfoX/Sxy family transcriptional regulator of competence genes
MASNVDTVQYICDQAGLGRRLAFRKMFGEYALYLDGKVVALICDDQLFLKPTSEGRSYLGKVSEAPPYPGAKNYFLLASELDDPDRLGKALQITAGALPQPKPRATRKKRAAARAPNDKKKPSPRKS